VTHGEAFRVLGLRPGASLGEIKRSHDELAGQWHPESHAGTPQTAALAATRRDELATALALLAPPVPDPVPAPDAPHAAPAQPFAPAPSAQVQPGVESSWHAGQGPTPPPPRFAPPGPPHAQRRSTGVRNMLIGAGLALLGILVTVGTHEAAAGSGGGTYLIMYGPIVGGALLFFQGLGQAASS